MKRLRLRFRRPIALYLALSAFALPVCGITPLLDKIPSAIGDRQEFQCPDQVRLAGWVCGRIQANEANYLVKLDPARLLEGYRKRPGRQAWDGEHVSSRAELQAFQN